MSHLRDIMRRLAANRSDRAAPTPPPPTAPDLASYRQRLRSCSKPMLDYEWTWLHQSLELDQPCLQAVEEECQERGLTPMRHPLAVAMGEHAWEVSNAAIRTSWGFDGQPA
jgi:hypothetical protein